MTRFLAPSLPRLCRFCGLLSLLFCLAVPVPAQTPDSTASAAAAPLPRQVWAHSIPTNAPYYDTLGNYGSNQPLLITGSTGADLTSVFQQVLDAGVDGIAVDLYTTPTDIVSRLQYGDQLGFQVSYCVDTGTEPNTASTSQIIQDVVSGITSYASLAAGHRSAQTYNGKYVVWTYNDSAHLAPADWATVRSLLTAANVPVSLFGDVGGQYMGYGAETARQATMKSLLVSFDQAYTFGPSSSSDITASALTGFMLNGSPFAWTTRPGYLHVAGSAASGNTIGYSDSQGTLAFQTAWQDIESKSYFVSPTLCRTAFVATFDDFAENTCIVPSTDMNTTFSEMNSWFASQFKGLPSPFPDARQYLTVQQSGYLGKSVLLEVTVINPTTTRDYVYPVVQNINSSDYGNEFGGVCPPCSISRFTLTLPVTPALESAMSINGVSALKVYSVLTNGLSGSTVAATVSPKVVLFSASVPTGGGQALYYSVASDHTTGYTPSGTLNISPSGVKTLSITPAGNGYVPRSLELLHDTRRAFISYGSGPVSGVIFTDLNRQADNRNDPTDHGCYIIREVTTSGKETYSDPLNVTHH